MRANNPNGKISSRNKRLTRANGSFNGKVRLRVDNIDLPLRTKKPTVWAIWNDLFHEDVPWEFIDQAFYSMWVSPRHLYFVLTKRPKRMLEYMSRPGFPGATVVHPLPNVWIGVTAENQEQADKRIPILLQIPAAKRYVSIEPMLGPVNLALYLPHAERGRGGLIPGDHTLDWIICGGESGHGARPMHPDWARNLRDQCKVAGVPYFLKQWGEWSANYGGYPTHAKEDIMIRHKVGHPSCLKVWRVGKKSAGRIMDGKEYLEVPKI